MRILILLLPLLLTAQQIKLEGSVLEQETELPLPGARIILDNSDGKLSDKAGKFRFETTKGKHILTVKMSGYKTYSREITITKDTTIKVSLIPFTAELPYVTIIGGSYDKIKEIPGSFYFIPTKELNAYTYIDPTRALQTLPGVNVQEEDGFGLRPNIGLRGTSLERSSKIAILEDGVPMSPAPYTAPAAYYSPFILRMSSIEVTKGIFALKYGPQTIGGTINYISTPVSDIPTAMAKFLYGSWNTQIFHSYVSTTYKKVGILLESARLKSDGFKQLYVNDEKLNTGPDKQDYIAKIKFNPTENHSIIVKAGMSSENSNVTYTGLTKSDFEKNPYQRYAATQYDNIKVHQKHINIFHVWNINKIKINTVAYYNTMHRSWYKLNKVNGVSLIDIFSDTTQYNSEINILRGQTSSDSSLIVRNNNRSYFSEGIKTVAKMKFNTEHFNNEIDVAVGIHSDGIDRYEWQDYYKMDNEVMKLTAKGPKGGVSNRKEQTTSIYSFVEWEMNYKKFYLTPIARYENIRTLRNDYGKNDPERTGNNLKTITKYFSVILPGVNLAYEINSKINLFGSVYKGFTPPSTAEGVYPELSVNYELGTKIFTKNILSEVLFFRSDYQNLIGSDLDASGGTGSLDNFNAGKASAWGIEVFNKTTVFPQKKIKLPLMFSYTYTEAFFKETFYSPTKMWSRVSVGDNMPYIPRHQLTFTSGIQYDKINISLRSRYQSAMWSRPGKGDLNAATTKIPAYFISDLSASYNISPNVSLHFIVNNVFNEVYLISDLPAGLRPGRPRMIKGGVSISL